LTPQQADLVFKNGAVYTVNPNRDWAQAVAVAGERIVYVGSDSGADAFIGPETTLIDLDNKMLLPGFIDSHAHPSDCIDLFLSINLYSSKSVEDYQKVIAKYIKENPDEPVYRGGGWDNLHFPPTGPGMEILDALCPDRPISLISVDGHSLWVNSKTLEVVHITKDTPNPEGGVIERHPQTGELTGTLRENAMKLVEDVLPPYSQEQRVSGLTAYQKMAAAAGITSAHDAMLDVPAIQAFKALESEGQLAMRFRGAIDFEPDAWEAQLDMLIEERKKNQHPFFQIHTAKIFVDGVVEGSTAFLLEPYEHMPGFRGEPLWRAIELNEVTAAVDEEGIQIHVHAIGDAAVKMTLDAFAYARQVNGERDSRHLITHIQLMAPEDVPRFHALGVIGVVQPFWFKIDDYYWNLSVPFLGKERANRNYPMHSLIETGARIASASDFPVTVPCDPLIGIEAGITRTERGTGLENSLWPEECASLEEMVATFTLNGAYANFLENETGSIEEGKQADLIVIDQNLFEIPPQEISQASVLFTMVGGCEVFRDSGFMG
jgi:predicted amidohydrolase YtcJ